MLRRFIPAAALAVLSLGASANAAVISFSDTIAITDTNWTDTATLSQFDPSLGTLTSIKITLDGIVQGDAQVENLSTSSGTTATLDLQADITLTGPNALVINVLPLASNMAVLTTFDGVIDFLPTSGASFLGLMSTDSDMQTLNNPVDFGPYMGLGNIVFNLTANGMSIATGGGNLISAFNTDAGATVTIEYTFTNAIPEPASLAMAAVGAVALGLVGLRRRARVA